MSFSVSDLLTQNSSYDGGPIGPLSSSAVAVGKKMKPAPIALALSNGPNKVSWRGMFGGPWPWIHKAVIIAQPAVAPTGASIVDSKNPLDQQYGPPGTPINPTTQIALAGKVPALGW